MGSIHNNEIEKEDLGKEAKSSVAQVVDVATLALGSRPRQRGCKGAGQREARESHQGLPGV